MITVYPYETIGRVEHGWLDARHHFSFGGYMNRNRMNFGVLRVINDDIIAAGTGFDTHPHADMEIITYVREGAIIHRDSQGNEGRTNAGDVQVMSAGSGIQHSEHTPEDETTNLYQIWIMPRKKGVAPSWDARVFPKEPVTDALQLLVSGDGKAPLSIHQDAWIYGGRLNAGAQVTQSIAHGAYILASDGALEVNGVTLNKGDGAEVTDESEITLKAVTNAEVLVIDVPPLSAAA